jgi:acetyl-CoA C-acetyltransferase
MSDPGATGDRRYLRAQWESPGIVRPLMCLAVESISYEDLGFADRFGVHKLVEAEVTGIGGSLLVSPSARLKSKGHSLGATGVAQCVEVFEQLRGDACNRIDGARIALAHNIGGPTAVSAVTILEGPGTNGE